MLKDSLKYMVAGGLLAVVLGTGSFLLIPETSDFDEKEVSAEEMDYTRSLNGVPELNMKHYKLSSDKYLNYILLDKYSVGRNNPSSKPTWYSNLDKLEIDVELRAKVLNALGDKTALDKLNKEKAEEEKRKAEEEERRKAEEEAEKAENGLLDEGKSTDVLAKKADYVKSIETYYKTAFDIDFKDADWTTKFNSSKKEFDILANSAINYMITLKDSKDFDSEYSEHLLKVTEKITKLNDVYLDSKFNIESEETKKSIESLKTEIEGSLKDLVKSLE